MLYLCPSLPHSFLCLSPACAGGKIPKHLENKKELFSEYLLFERGEATLDCVGDLLFEKEAEVPGSELTMSQLPRSSFKTHL